MKRLGITAHSLLLAAVVFVAMLLLPGVASAHGMADHPPLMGFAEAVQGSIGTGDEECVAACVTQATIDIVHCYLSSASPITERSNAGLDDLQPIAAASEVPNFVARNLGRYSSPRFMVAIAETPRFILFGNFRS